MGRTLGVMGRRPLLRLLVAGLAVSAGLLVPASASAHPLGNFTINHYAGLRIAPDRVDLDIVIDMAEIPTFQERQAMDADGDGSVSDPEGAAWAGTTCATLTASLHLTRDAAPVALATGSSIVSFPSGAGGLSTLRLECAYVATFASPIVASTDITFGDASYHDRIGWHEVVATGDGTTLDTHGLPATSPSHRLTEYPKDLVSVPLDVRTATITAVPGPPAASSAPVASGQPGAGSVVGPGASVAPGASAAPAGAVPGGVAGELPDIFRTVDLTPFVILASLLTAVVIGAGHALTPGHGKTLMAAYLVGSRGTAVHAVGLGLSVAVSHTLGILALAFVIVGAGSILPPDAVYRVTPVIAGSSIVLIGGWMLVSEIRRRRRASAVRGAGAAIAAHDQGIHVHGLNPARRAEDRVTSPRLAVATGYAGSTAGVATARRLATAASVAGFDAFSVRASTAQGGGERAQGGGEHVHAHDGVHAHEAAHAHGHDGAHAHDGVDAHEDAHAHGHDGAHALDDGIPDLGEHSHGGVRHSHLPPAGSTLSWRGLFVLGLAGGLIPSTSALLILLGSIAAGRPAFGLVLVVAFGIGMAAVMTGVGLAMIVARTRLDRMPSRSGLGRLATVAPLVASIAVLGLGLVLTWQALAGAPVL
jgi:nickel/cobalt transporter (NicO) family protein